MKSPEAKFAADAAEEHVLVQCVICGMPVSRPTTAKGLATCSAGHARIAKEAAAGTSPSTIMLCDARGGEGRLSFRAYGVPEVAAVRMMAVEARSDGRVFVTGGSLTIREARLFAAALLRAARRAEGKAANPTLEA